MFNKFVLIYVDFMVFIVILEFIKRNIVFCACNARNVPVLLAKKKKNQVLQREFILKGNEP